MAVVMPSSGSDIDPKLIMSCCLILQPNACFLVLVHKLYLNVVFFGEACKLAYVVQILKLHWHAICNLWMYEFS